MFFLSSLKLFCTLFEFVLCLIGSTTLPFGFVAKQALGLMKLDTFFEQDDKIASFWVCLDVVCLLEVNLDSSAAGTEDDKGALSIFLLFVCDFF